MGVRFLLVCSLVAALCGATPPAAAIQIERIPPYDFVAACSSVSAPVSLDGCVVSDSFAVQAGSFAHPRGRAAATALATGVRSSAHVGIVLTVPAGKTLEVSADVAASGAGRFKVCLLVGTGDDPSEHCLETSGDLTLSTALSAFPDAAVIGDPRVRVAAGEDCALACAGVATIEVHRFVYRVV